MKEKLQKIISFITGCEKGCSLPGLINIAGQFRPSQDDNGAVARNLNAAFLIALSGEAHPDYHNAAAYLDSFASHPSWGISAGFYKKGLELIFRETLNRCYDDGQFETDVSSLYTWLTDPDVRGRDEETAEKIRRVFFPEGVSLCENTGEKIEGLRKKRTVSITKLNPAPVSNPARQILFTSNILITVPSSTSAIDGLPLSPGLKSSLQEVSGENQAYWYDHPVPIGVPPEQNEILYGLEGLDRAVEFEKQRGTIERGDRITCLLSVSVTHKGLHRIARKYIDEELRKEKSIEHTDLYVITEADAVRISDEILIPAARKYLGFEDAGTVFRVFGVDGEYGRHYSFLKAVSLFWNILISPEIKGTFKIDLDQVFPQKELVEQSGSSAFEHFTSPLWGAEGIDYRGDSVELGMIAGALVNQKDITGSLFTPDVCFPSGPISADELIFYSPLPQALSTEAEMMTRYGRQDIDGASACIQRVHVTGGTSGILLDHLRRYRPFTPTFIGRAEDQAYLLSVLFEGEKSKLRCLHKDGLIMRHDKEAFAGEAIRRAASGKLIGDYIRILMFSYYAQSLPWPVEETKDAIDPFTGCFVSRIPLTVVYLRFALKTASFFSDPSEGTRQQGRELMNAGTLRLSESIDHLTNGPNPLIHQFTEEKKAWNTYYNILDVIEEKIKEGDPYALALQEKAKEIIENCRIGFA